MVPHHPPVTAVESAGKGRVHLLRPLLPAVRALRDGLSRLAGLRGRPAGAHPGVDRSAGLVAPLLQPLLAAAHEPGWPAARGLPAPRLPRRYGCGRTVVSSRAVPGLGIGQGPIRAEGGWLVSHPKDRPDYRPRRASAAEEKSDSLAASTAEHTEIGRCSIPKRSSSGSHLPAHLHLGPTPRADHPRHRRGNRTDSARGQPVLPPQSGRRLHHRQRPIEQRPGKMRNGQPGRDADLGVNGEVSGTDHPCGQLHLHVLDVGTRERRGDRPPDLRLQPNRLVRGDRPDRLMDRVADQRQRLDIDEHAVDDRSHQLLSLLAHFGRCSDQRWSRPPLRRQ